MIQIDLKMKRVAEILPCTDTRHILLHLGLTPARFHPGYYMYANLWRNSIQCDCAACVVQAAQGFSTKAKLRLTQDELYNVR
jgi:hypothetical protein